MCADIQNLSSHGKMFSGLILQLIDPFYRLVHSSW